MSIVNSTDIEDLIRWARRHHSSLDSAVEIYCDDLTGLSFRAADDITEGTRLVDCSYETTLSYLNAIEGGASFSRHTSESFPAEFLSTLSQYDPNVIGYFFLIQQYFLLDAHPEKIHILTQSRYLLKERSFWWDYIRLLPQPNEPERLSVPILWPESDQRFLDGTNAEPAIQKRRQLWESEWSQGIALLKLRFEGWEGYSFALYQWAAAIFGSRSFRPSLTVSPEIFHQQHETQADLTMKLDHIAKDSFSILLPVLDIGNHNGSEEVDWTRCSNSFQLSNRRKISKSSQIYNFYGNKSNSELLVAYGFILPQADNDRVNLKFNPPPDIQRLRQSQASHVIPNQNQREEEFMFNIGINSNQEILSLSYFSDGLFDTTICMVANSRERQWISKNLDYSPEKDTAIFYGPLARGAYQALGALQTKLELELARLKQTQPDTAQNQNQNLASEYRKRQEKVLNTALPIISQQLSSMKLVSLDSAFRWLKSHYAKLSTELETLISQDQEEPLPLNWDILAEDWYRTYLIVWIYLILSLEKADPSSFQVNHPALHKWISNFEITERHTDNQLFAEKSEIDTINLMVNFVADRFGHDELSRRKMRNQASFITKEEAIRGIPDSDNARAISVVQDMLCIELE